MKEKIIRIIFIITIIALNIGCDQSTKHAAKKHLKYAGTVQVIGNYAILRYAENKGAFLSMFTNLPRPVRIALLIILPMIVLTGMIGYIIYQPTIPPLYLAGFCFVIGGGMSNVFDRIFNNENVIDFMNVGIGSIRSGIFNFADLSIMAGIIILLYINYQDHQKQKNITAP